MYFFLLFCFSCHNKKETVKSIKGKEIAISQLDDFIRLQMDTLGIIGTSISVINDDKIVYSGHFGKKNTVNETAITNETLYEVASLSKPVFSFFVMKQVEKGLLDLDKPLYQYLEYPDIAYDERYKKITARMVLCHSSGLPNWRSQTNDSLKILFEPGTKYGYSGEGYQYLKDVLTEVLHVNDVGLNRIFQEEIAYPMRIKHMSFTWKKDYKKHKAYGHLKSVPTGNDYKIDPELFGAAYSLYATSDAYAKFLIALIRKQILHNDIFEELMRTQYQMPSVPDVSNHRSLIFNIKQTPDGERYFHSGSNGDFQSWTHFYPQKGFGIVILTNGDNLFSSGFAEKLLVFLDETVGKN